MQTYTKSKTLSKIIDEKYGIQRREVNNGVSLKDIKQYKQLTNK